MPTSRLATIGILIALIGWALLLFGGELSVFLAGVLGHPVPISIDPGRVDVAQSLILSGFGLAILGTLRAGVAALQLFFSAVLERVAAARAQQAVAEPPPAAPQPITVIERGRIRDRPYIRYSDGSVEVETLLGVRRFASLTDAESFVGA